MHALSRRLRPAWFVLVAALAFGLSQGERVLASGLPEREETGSFPKSGLFSVRASGQTGPVSSADDPAIWVHPTDPSLSVVIGTNKNTSGGLHVFDLQGRQLQFVAGGKHNNVDVRYGFMLGGVSVDLVSVCDRNNDQLDIYTIDPATRLLTQVGTVQAGIEVYGYAMYHSRTTGKFYGFVASSDGVEQWEFVDRGNGTVGGVRVRTFPSGHLIEGIAADDELGYLYLAEESQGIFKYYAEPDRPTTRLATVDVVGSATQLIEDVEGLTIYYRRNGTGYLIASSQGNDRFVVYRREGNNQYLGTFEVPEANSTDGIDVINMALGPLYPLGMFVAQNGDRDFQMVRWQDIATALGLAIDTQGYNVRGVSDCASVASVNVVPASASVEVGATLQLGATLRDGGGAPLFGCALTWSTSDDAIATVGANGLVTGVFQGPATITATSGGVSGSSAITVPAPPVATGLRSPTANAAVTSSAGDNNGFQTSPANAHAGDGLFAVDTNSGTGTSTSCTNNGKDKHLFYNYGLSIPPGSTIKGIEVRLDAKVDSTSGSPKFCVQLSSNGGASWTAAKSTARLATSGATYMLGSATDTWGRSWTVGDLADAGFRVRVISVANSTSRDFSLDWIAVRVTYQPSP
jgi:myo-inositol-hexaphosphate 3-phosphohydrolase